MSDDALEEAKRRLPLPALMAQLGDGDRAGKSAPCPFHEDSSPSFSVFPSEDGLYRWKCHAGCGQGDAIDYLQRRRGLSTADAIREFKRMAGVETPTSPKSPVPAPAATQPSFDWAACVVAFGDEDAARLAEWRGYSPEFVAWLRTQSWIGLFHGQLALPVHDADGRVVACHYRQSDGGWRYHPTGLRTHPLVINTGESPQRVLAFESQWDAFAVMDRLGWHQQAQPGTAVIATRGAANSRLVAPHASPNVTVFAFVQNDEPGRKWLQEIAKAHSGEVREVKTPPPHKDANDWTRSGARQDEIQSALAEAKRVPKPISISAAPAPSTPTAPRVPTTPFPDDDTDDAPHPFPTHLLPPTVAAMVRETARVLRACQRPYRPSRRWE